MLRGVTLTVPKVAAGVFFGIIAVLAVIQIPKALGEWGESQYEKRAEKAVNNLSPDAVIARCGAPAKEEADPTIKWRYIYYKTDIAIEVWLTFAPEPDGKWMFMGMHDNIDSPYHAAS